jgi:hypothetical protein
MPIFVFNHCSPRISTRPGNDQIPQLMEVRRCHRLGESELASEDRRDSNFIGLDIDVGGDNRTSRIIDTLSLIKQSEMSGV